MSFKRHTNIGTIGHLGLGNTSLTAAIASVLAAESRGTTMTTNNQTNAQPALYANCKFQICDLPGQCKGEGRCHHPATLSYQDKMRERQEQPAGERAELITKLREATQWPSADHVKGVLRQAAAMLEADAQRKAKKPLTDLERMKIIGDEFPLAFVDPIVIAKIDSVCKAIEAARRNK